MTYLPQQTKLNLGDQIFAENHINAEGKHVVIIGGGDTAADCLGTALRQGGKKHQAVRHQRDAAERARPEPDVAGVADGLRTSAAHEEGENLYDELRNYAVLTKAFVGDDAGHVRGLRGVRIESRKDAAGVRHVTEVPGGEFELPCDLCLLAIGFTGPDATGPIADLRLKLTGRGAVKVNDGYMTSTEGVFAAGDARRGQSLVVYAISEGRQAARCCDEWLMGRSDLPELPLEL